MEPDSERLRKAWKLTDEEEEGVLLPSGLWQAKSNSHNLCLMGKLLSDKPYKFEALCSSIQSMHLPVDDSGCSWGASLRIRVGLNVNRPLKRALKVRSMLGEELLVRFTYDRLPNFYYLCGLLGHIDKYSLWGANQAIRQDVATALERRLSPPRQQHPIVNALNEKEGLEVELFGRGFQSAAENRARGLFEVGIGAAIKQEGDMELNLVNIRCSYVSERCDRIKDLVHYHGVGLDSVGEGGGLLLLWCKILASGFNFSQCITSMALLNLMNVQIGGVLLDFMGTRSMRKKGPSLDLIGRLEMFKNALVSAGFRILVLKGIFILGAIAGRNRIQFKLGWIVLVVTPCGPTYFLWLRCKSKELNDKIYELQERAITPSVKSELEILKDSLERLAATKEILWKQRAKALWLAAGDRNTIFFHAKANERRLRKEIKIIKNEKVQVVSDREGVQKVILHYFHSIFWSTHPTADTMEEVFGSLDSRVTTAMNNELLKLFTSEEIMRALRQMHPLKSPGSDISPSQSAFPDALIPITYELTTFFSIRIEAFSGMVRKEEMNGAILGVSMTRSAPPIPHLLFANDTLIFCQATQEAMLCLKGILLSFEKAYRLKINLQNSAMVFSNNVIESLRLELAGILGVVVANKHDKYLGLCTVAGRSKKQLFEGIKDLIWYKLHNWSAKSFPK
ncbi:UNVERIFIED_CONTAM: hypothetical protein Slati_2385200 [Sesamum latifolium]|uniref:Zinc knuckle CX2CX4HX4C domain-containing protein n=1 Tax=Sesamum latifolium TaxID=2727402 RepID=A0AAW2WFB8_9LAMI